MEQLRFHTRPKQNLTALHCVQHGFALVSAKNVPFPKQVHYLITNFQRNGRAQLQVVDVQRKGRRRLEPQVKVIVSPGLRAQALQATALHELGHAFGLWGHSSVPTDVLAISQGERPVLVPSQRDRLTLAWVMQQTTRFGSTLRKPIEPAESESLE